MDLGFLKLAINPIRWLCSLFADQTGLKISGQDSSNYGPEILCVTENKPGEELLLFALTTSSKETVEITEINIQFSSPLKMMDPGNRGFFVSEGANNNDFPFRLKWKGSAEVRHGLMQAFIVKVKMPQYPDRIPVRIFTRAHKLHTSTGQFVRQGRIQILQGIYYLVKSSEKLGGIAIPPGWGMTSVQPFFIEGAISASGGPGNIVIHELLKDGTGKSKIVEIGAKSKISSAP